MFVRVLVSEEGDLTGELQPPFELLLHASGTAELGVGLQGGAKQMPRDPIPGV
jgi:hypothetical protein